jgi:hypothetical protein
MADVVTTDLASLPNDMLRRVKTQQFTKINDSTDLFIFDG